MLVVVDFFLLILVWNLTLFILLNHLLLLLHHCCVSILLSNLRLGGTRPIFQLRPCELVQHLLELLICLLKIIILLKLESFLLQLLRPARLETTPSVSTSTSEALLRSTGSSSWTWCMPSASGSSAATSSSTVESEGLLMGRRPPTTSAVRSAA